MIEKKDITARLRAKKLIRGRDLDIRCDTITAISNKDIIEFYLFLSGAAHWRWFDVRGRSLSRQSFPRISVNLLRDVLQWPFLYLKTLKEITSHSKVSNITGRLNGDSSLLFLRTDHWFNVRSGGSVGHLSGVINGFRTLGHKTNVVSTDSLVNVEKDKDFYLCPPVYGIGRNIPNMSALLYNNQLISFIENRWNELRPSFIYQRYSLGNYVGVSLKDRYKIPYVCEYNGSFPWMARNWGGRKLFHEKILTCIELLNLHAADLIVVVSQPMKDELVERGIDAGKILVNPNGVDPDRYSPMVNESPVRTQYGLSGKRVIGFIGTFGKWHGAEVLAEAFGILVKKYPEYKKDARLLLIGDGVNMPLVKEILNKHNIEDICILPGLMPQEEGPAHLAACDILASPHVPNPDGTPFFGSPTKLFEYMSMGKGIVASDLDQIGEVLAHGKTAWMVKPGDPEDLVEGLNRLLDDQALRKSLGENARKEAVSKYAWKEHTRRIIAKLEEIVR